MSDEQLSERMNNLAKEVERLKQQIIDLTSTTGIVICGTCGGDGAGRLLDMKMYYPCKACGGVGKVRL